MSLIEELLAGLDSVDPAKAEQLRSEIASADALPAEPPKPPTILDEIRDGHALDVSEIPSLNELPYLAGALAKRFRELEAHVHTPADNVDAPAVDVGPVDTAHASAGYDYEPPEAAA